MNTVKQRWNDFWQLKGVDKSIYSAEYSALDARYGEPHRAYHDIGHIHFCLGEFDRVRSMVQDAAAVEIAIWYHDVVYDTRRNDNEEQSVAFAKLRLPRLANIPDIIEDVAGLILATKHTFLVTKPDEQLIVDIDLSGFGQDWTIVAENSRDIRYEYSWMPEDDYVNGRRTILQSFLARPDIYYLPDFKERYERKARENIARELGCLRELARPS